VAGEGDGDEDEEEEEAEEEERKKKGVTMCGRRSVSVGMPYPASLGHWNGCERKRDGAPNRHCSPKACMVRERGGQAISREA
jgi:hypothetical protein